MRFGYRAAALASRLSVGFALVATLSGCVEVLPQPESRSRQPAHASITPRPGVSPSGASIAFVGLAGAPETVRKLLGEAMTGEVNGRKLVLADVTEAKYIIRGNISAYTAGKSTQVAFVWDIYGADKRFRHRLQDVITISRIAAESWSVVDERVTREIASRSAGQIAAFLTHTPEAIAKAGKAAVAGAPAVRPNASAGGTRGGAVIRTSSGGNVQPLGYAPAR